MLEDREQYLHIPSYVLNDINLDPTKKILFSYILSLSNTPKGCYSSNKDFGKKLGINPDGASKQISKLKKIGYIATRYKDGYRLIDLLKFHKHKDKNDDNVYINIPYSVLLDTNISSTQKLLLSEIIALLKLPDGCYKSNNDFGKLIGICGNGISKQIKKLVEINYITTKEFRINNVIHHRKIELGTSYLTKEILPISQEDTSNLTKEILPISQEDTSCRNTINSSIISIESFQSLPQFTSTEKIEEMSEKEILETEIINSFEFGEEILDLFKRNNLDDIWKYAKTKQDYDNIQNLFTKYKQATSQ